MIAVKLCMILTQVFESLMTWSDIRIARVRHFSLKNLHVNSVTHKSLVKNGGYASINFD
jgi:hypothetical protein